MIPWAIVFGLIPMNGIRFTMMAPVEDLADYDETEDDFFGFATEHESKLVYWHVDN